MDCYWRRGGSCCFHGYCWICNMVDAQEGKLQKGTKTVRIKVNLRGRSRLAWKEINTFAFASGLLFY